MPEITNPFIDSITIPDDYFCKRDRDTEMLVENIRSSVNTVLYAPRRVGKSSLIKHVLGRKEIKDSYNSLYVDLLGTRDSISFVEEFQKALLEADFAKDEKIRQTLLAALPAMMSAHATSPISMTMSQIFSYLESTKKPTVVVFDEFQVIEQYDEPMAAILRGEIQKLRRTKFIFSGSETHMLSMMFNNRNRPFFSSARDMSIDVIPIDDYVEYCQRMFGLFGKCIEADAVRLTYYTFSGITRANQDIMRAIFHRIQAGQTAAVKDVAAAIKSTIISKEESIRTTLGKMSANAYKLFKLIAVNGVLENPTSKNKNTDLSQSQIQHLANKYCQEESALLTRLGKNSLKITDKLMELFLLGPENLECRLSRSEEIFNRERLLSSQNLPQW